MSERFKFRCWDALSNPPRMMLDDETCDFTVEQLFSSELQPMQFTGLHDRNGVEIYEGDILRREIPNVPMLVRWNDKYAQFDLVDPGKSGDFLTAYVWFQGGSHEVIGNIWENPELLERK